MKMNRFAKQLVAEAGLFFLCAIPVLTLAQSAPPTPVETPTRTTRSIRTKKQPGPMDDFAGLNYTDDQKARINQIHEDMQARLDKVIKDDKLSPEQKGAMIQGFEHMVRGEVYKVLTPEQRLEVRKRILARRAEARKEQQETNKQATPVPYTPPRQPPSQPSKPPQPPA